MSSRAKSEDLKAEELIDAESPSAGALVSTLFRLSWPIFLANVAQTVYQTVNMFWIGCLDVKSVAAVSACYPIIALLTGLYTGLLTASFVLVAQYSGADDQSQVNCVTAQSLILLVMVALFLAGSAFIASHRILDLIGLRADIIGEATPYLHISLLGGCFTFLVGLYGSVMRGRGEVRMVLYVTALGVVLNMLLDPLLILGGGPVRAGGVVGAAYATLAAQGATAVVAVRGLSSGGLGAKLRVSDFVPNGRLLKRLVMLGAPAAFMGAMDPISLIVLTGIVARFGTIAIAANGVALKLFGSAMILLSSTSTAVGILVGRAMGGGDARRAERLAVQSTWILLAISAILALLVIAMRLPLIKLFVPVDPALIAEGGRAIRMMSLCFVFVAIWLCLSSTFSSAGDTVFPMIATVTIYWTVEIPVAWILSKYTAMGTEGIWVSYPASAGVAAIVAIIWFKVGRWKLIDLTGVRGRM